MLGHNAVSFRSLALALSLAIGQSAAAQSFSKSTLDLNGLASVSLGTSLEFGPDGRLYVLQIDGTIHILTIARNGIDDYELVAAEELLDVKLIPNHNDDGSPSGIVQREALGITVAGTATAPVIYATSSDSRIGGPSGDTELDTNSGVITRLSWVGVDLTDPNGFWDVVDLVRGLPRSEENHATNGLELVEIGGNDFLIVASGGHTNAGSPSANFAWVTEYALSAALLAIDLTQLEQLPILNDGPRRYVYDLPTVDDPTRANANGVDDPSSGGYDGVDAGDPWGGNDGLNQAKLVPGGPVQMFSPGFRNAFGFVVTSSGAVYVTDNGANAGWGGYPDQEGGANVTNDYRVGEPGSNGPDPVDGEDEVNNNDHLTLVTTDIETYVFGSFYGGHPCPIRANPSGAGLFARGPHSDDPADVNGNTYVDDWFRTQTYDPSAGGDAADPTRALPADWPPVPLSLANSVEGDYRNPGGTNPDGSDDVLVTTWTNNTNGIVEYTATNFSGAMQGNLVAGRNTGKLHRIELQPDGSLAALTEDWLSNLGGNPLGLAANSDDDPFPGTIWVATFHDHIMVFEPQDFGNCIAQGEPGYDPQGDYDADGYTNDDEILNGTDPCNGGSQPDDFDRIAGAPYLSDLLDDDDDADGIPDSADTLQLGDPTDSGGDQFPLPVRNDLFSDNGGLGGYLGLGFTGLMNNGSTGPNWLDWIDRPSDGPNPNDVLGGATGAITMQMTSGTALGSANSQDKGFQYAVDVDTSTATFVVESRLINFASGSQLYAFVGNGQIGIQIGDGTQSNFIQLAITQTGVELLQELSDTPNSPMVAVIQPQDRPTSSMTLRFEIDCIQGSVEGLYSSDGGAFTSVGSFSAGGAVLAALQQSGAPIHVGVIGTSNTTGAEVEGTWDYLYVYGPGPTLTQTLPDIHSGLGAADRVRVLDLDDYFEADSPEASLTYTLDILGDIWWNSASITGSTLTVTIPEIVSSATLTVRATDVFDRFVEQSFVVEVLPPVALYRVNAGGPEVAAIDGGVPWERDTDSENSRYLANPAANQVSGFSMNSYDARVDQSSTPISIFQSERWDNQAGAPHMTYSFPVEPGHYGVRLYMGNGSPSTSGVGERVFNVLLEGTTYPRFAGIDLSAMFGHGVGGVIERVVPVSDGTLNIEFRHGAANNPLVNAIEIVPADRPIVPSRTRSTGTVPEHGGIQ